MASTYNKNGIIYISWWDPNLERTKNKSTRLPYNRQNLLKARKLARMIQDKLNEDRETNAFLGIQNTTIKSAFDHYIRNNSDKDPKTVIEYNGFFKRFTEKFPKESGCTIITKLNTEEWLNGIKTLPLQRNTKYNICKNLKKFLSFLFEYNYIPYFKLNKDVVTRPEVKEIIIFNNDDVEKIFKGLNKKNQNFSIMMHILFLTGLRPTDIIDITVGDIDLEKKILKYYSRKVDEHYVIPIHDDLIPVLKNRIDEVKEGRIIEYKSISEMGKAFRRYLKQIKLTGKKYNLRTFRKSFISFAYDSNIELATVSKLVGHRNISTTAKFYNKISILKQASELSKLSFPQSRTEVVDTKNQPN